MKYKKKIGAVLIFCVFLLSLAGCAPKFEGESVKNEDSYALDIEAMNGTDSHTLNLEEGDTLQLKFETEEGSLYMEIKTPSGENIYEGGGTDPSEFALTVPEDGDYTITVEGKKAKGSIRVDVKKAPALTAEEVVGSWHLDPEQNDEAELNEAFAGAMEFGNNMEITEDGKFSWYIGAEGGSGKYTLKGATINAEVTGDADGSAMALKIKADRTKEELLLVMEVNDMSLCWLKDETGAGKGETGKGETGKGETGKGETGKNEESTEEEEPWKTELAKDLLEKYGVIPEYYEDLGDGIYQVYVEVGGKVVPFVTVDSATGDYHG